MGAGACARPEQQTVLQEPLSSQSASSLASPSTKQTTSRADSRRFLRSARPQAATTRSTRLGGYAQISRPRPDNSDTLAAAAVSPIGAVLEITAASAQARGCRRLLEFNRQHGPAAAGHLKEPEGMPPDSPLSSKTLVNVSSRSAAPNARRFP